MHDLILRPGRERSLRRRHPWLMSGAVAELRGGEALPGAWVRVLSAAGEPLALGHYSPASQIRARLLAFGRSALEQFGVSDEAADEGLVAGRIAHALARRREAALQVDGDAQRLVNAEGDGLPGLVVDRYADVLVVKLSSAGMHGRRERIAEVLRRESGAPHGFLRADGVAARREGIAATQETLWGRPPQAAVAIRERDRHFQVDFRNGQKTGFYLDQRDARDLVSALADGREVLDLFCYSGAFGVAAALGGAKGVTLVDSSAEALRRAAAHVDANAPACGSRLERADAFQWLRDQERRYGLLVVDPPPLARHRGDVRRATRAYKDLLRSALRCAAPGALLLAFACSHHVGPELFRKLAFQASLEADRSLQVLRRLAAPADHPVSLDHPEGEYLCGLLLRA